jgi:hypothetical protein
MLNSIEFALMFSFGVSLAACGIGVCALFIGCRALTQVIGLQNSTHKIQYVPADGTMVSDKELNKEYDRLEQEAFDGFDDIESDLEEYAGTL